MNNLRHLTLALAAVSLSAVSAFAQGSAEVWLSTPDRTSLVAQQAQHPQFSAAETHAGATITVDDSKRFQSMEGFGFALTGGSAQLLMRMSPASRTALLKELFGSAPGSAGVSYLRVSIGSSDMNDHVFTYDDGAPDPTLARFSLGPDLQDVVPVLKEILAISPHLSILASPWSAPSWMKTNGLPKGGNLKPDDCEAYALYFVRYLQAMAAQGIPIRAITIQNEPRNANNTPSMLMSAREQAVFLGYFLGPALRKARLATEVILYDHNCDDPDYTLAILADPRASQYATGSGFHLYEGSIDALTKVHDAFPAKDLYFTEQMVIQPDTTHPQRLAHSVQELIIGAPRNWSRNVLLWNLAADPKNEPHTPDGGCPICQGAVTLAGDTVTRNLAFYTVAQVSGFVPPGSVRIASDPSVPNALPNVAFTTPDHRTVLVVANPGKAAQEFHVSFHQKEFAATLNAGDVATYRW